MFANLEEKLGFKFKNKDLLKSAFIHRSYLNEHPEETLPHNERLEFLGDSVLGFVVSEHLFEKYPNHPEGDLTNFRSSLVNARTLSEVSSNLDLGSFLFLSKGEEATGGRQRQYILANTFEALLGAIYLDSGIENAKKLIEAELLPKLSNIINKKLYKDFKSNFQEIAQEKRNITPTYKVISEEGPDHNRTFTVGVFLNEELVAQGSGKSKQTAEQEAASNAIAKLT
jgi:ribonuclease-3